MLYTSFLTSFPTTSDYWENLKKSQNRSIVLSLLPKMEVCVKYFQICQMILGINLQHNIQLYINFSHHFFIKNSKISKVASLLLNFITIVCSFHKPITAVQFSEQLPTRYLTTECLYISSKATNDFSADWNNQIRLLDKLCPTVVKCLCNYSW